MGMSAAAYLRDNLVLHSVRHHFGWPVAYASWLLDKGDEFMLAAHLEAVALGAQMMNDRQGQADDLIHLVALVSGSEDRVQ